VATQQVGTAGFSAGAAIAAADALVGGWRIATPAGEVAVCDEGAGEDLELVSVRPGLGLVPFAVDVHASQWGTVTRLLHAVACGAVAEGWAIDEDTLVTVAGDTLTVTGRGTAYRIRRGVGDAQVELLAAGAGSTLARSVPAHSPRLSRAAPRVPS
jgi:cyanophycinase